MVRSAVFNSSPWIFLTKLGIIEPALSLFQQIYVPLSVSKEILSKPDESASILEEQQSRIFLISFGVKTTGSLDGLLALTRFSNPPTLSELLLCKGKQ